MWNFDIQSGTKYSIDMNSGEKQKNFTGNIHSKIGQIMADFFANISTLNE